MDSVFSRLRDAFLLREEERKASRRSADTQARIDALARAAAELSSAARDLDPAASPRAIVFGHAHAIALLARAARVDEGRADPLDLTPRDAFEALGESPSGAPEGFRDVRQVFLEADPAAVFALDDERARSLANDAAETVEWMRKNVEPRSTAAIRRVRTARLAVAGFAALVLVALVVRARMAPGNLALGRVATASSLMHTSPRNGGVVNGEIEKSFGVHTTVEQDPWVKVDLGSVVELGEVRVFNRGDGWYDEVLPLTLEVSDDDAEYRAVASRTSSFSQAEPWVVSLTGTRARYVRLHKAQPGYIAVAELEVYGPGAARKN